MGLDLFRQIKVPIKNCLKYSMRDLICDAIIAREAPIKYASTYNSTQ